MRPTKSNTRRRSTLRTVLLVLLAIIIGGTGTVAALAALNIIDSARLAFWRKPPEATPVPADWVKVYVSVKPIPAHTAITDDYLKSPKTGKWVTLLVPPKLVSEGVIDDIHKIRGRVTARDIPAVNAFRESDFLPGGTRPGVVAGIPAGKRAITIDVSKISSGVNDVQAGDHVDLYESIPIDMPGSNHSGGGCAGAGVLMTPDATLVPKQSIVRSLVQDGVVVVPVHIRNVPTTSTSLMSGSTTRTRPVQEVVLAIDPEELVHLAAAIDLKYEITCVARSGLPTPGEEKTPNTASGAVGGLPNVAGSQTTAQPTTAARNLGPRSTKPTAKLDTVPSLNPMGEVRYMDVMVGDKRQFVFFNGPGNSPVIAGQNDESTKPTSAVPQPGAVEEKKE